MKRRRSEKAVSADHMFNVERNLARLAVRYVPGNVYWKLQSLMWIRKIRLMRMVYHEPHTRLQSSASGSVTILASFLSWIGKTMLSLYISIQIPIASSRFLILSVTLRSRCYFGVSYF